MNNGHHTLVAIYRNVPSSRRGLFNTFSFRKFESISSTSPEITHTKLQNDQHRLLHSDIFYTPPKNQNFLTGLYVGSNTLTHAKDLKLHHHHTAKLFQTTGDNVNPGNYTTNCTESQQNYSLAMLAIHNTSLFWLFQNWWSILDYYRNKEGKHWNA
jgi:hypothetical protein